MSYVRADSSINPDAWQLLSLLITRDAEEAASSLLFDLGTTGIITLEEKDESVRLGAYFDAKTDAEQIARAIEAEFARAGRLDALMGISVSEIPDQDWMQKWKEGFEPIEVGHRLVVAPSWKLPDKSEGRAVIQIDPGMAFVTGTHEATRLCLELIEAHWQGGKLLDVGTGTGILAIAASLVAPGSAITAIDVDPQAVEVARENVAINNASESIEIIEGQPRDFDGQAFDMVVANLTAEVIINLMSELASCMAPAGMMILSGILTELRSDVERAARDAGLVITHRRDAGEWAALVARQRGV